MMANNVPTLTSDQVIDAFSHKKEISDVSVKQRIDLRLVSKRDLVSKPITFRNCKITELEASYLFYDKPVILEGCEIEKANFDASYLLAGGMIINCTFLNNLSLMSMGGHNQPGKTFTLVDCIFNGFVNFWDAWFQGPFEVTRCQFKQGTNLLGFMGGLGSVTFDIPPIIEDNAGKLDEAHR
jgi:hypothetical protein